MHERTLSDAIALIVVGTINATLALALLSWRNPTRRLRWTLRDPNLADMRLAYALTGLGIVAVIWGGIGLQDWVPTPLAVVIAIAPTLLLRLAVWRTHNRRVTPD